ncbi:unnamed protein product [Ostreobium quekettii]|uniref:Uncharacterized protein n=1 Tax=Ostreobium quekettii TaxID=121088 RepID=A0A8S1J4S7_9CHLO|nr:unnamed protein product [Ostreobium quekettii]
MAMPRIRRDGPGSGVSVRRQLFALIIAPMDCAAHVLTLLTGGGDLVALPQRKMGCGDGLPRCVLFMANTSVQLKGGGFVIHCIQLLGRVACGTEVMPRLTLYSSVVSLIG